MHASLGLDFGTLSVRALVVALDGRELGSAVAEYPHGQIVANLPGKPAALPPDFALQHPQDWLDAASAATRAAMAAAGSPELAGIGVDFTSCTMLPTLSDGTPLCRLDRFRDEPQAWPKLWKHHGAVPQARRMTRLAGERGESFLSRYGGVIGEEWLFPKILEAIETAPEVAAAAEVWLEAGDWFVWQLTGGPAGQLPRSTCQAGYKALWSERDGYPPADYLAAVHPALADAAARRLPGRMVAPGRPAGRLTAEMADRFGLPAGLPLSAAIIDAHAGVPGAGAGEPGTLVMVMGTSSCHMLNSEVLRDIPGVAGVVKDGILPGYFGYETGQAAVGDAFDWLRRLTGQPDFAALSAAAAELPPGAGGVRCVDWFNGCRTPRMDGSLRGAFSGLSLHHGPAHLHRALMEATACGVRWIVDLMREAGVPVRHFIATGGLPHHDPFLIQLHADVLGETIAVPPSRQGPALGAAILGALAAGAFPSAAAAIAAMTSSATPARFHPGPQSGAYHSIYEDYRRSTAR
jgi:L-ribulokinase